jgi:hypothetical protein
VTAAARFSHIGSAAVTAILYACPSWAQQAPAATPNAQVEAAIVAAAASIACAILSFVVLLFNEFRRRANDRKIVRLNAEVQEKLLGLKRQSDEEIARVTAAIKLQGDLQLAAFSKSEDERLSAAAARRAYEYEARKRLYQDCEPLLFQLSQNAGVAIGRVVSLAREAREGRLAGPDGSLSGDPAEDSGRGYYFRSTLYQLLAPLAIAYLLRTHLTLQDMALDPWVKREFSLSDAAYRAFTRDFHFASLNPVIPNYREQADKPSDPAASNSVLKQGIFLGRLDNLIESLIATEREHRRLIAFGRFEELLVQRHSAVAHTLKPLMGIVANFHPHTHPVFWRILCAEYFLFRALRLDTRQALETGLPDRALAEVVVEPNHDDLHWKTVVDEEVLGAMRIGREYMVRSLRL